MAACHMHLRFGDKRSTLGQGGIHLVMIHVDASRLSGGGRSESDQRGWISCNVTSLEDVMAFKLNRSLGMTILGIYLILVGISGLVALGLPPVLMAGLALVAGIMILVGR
jgi:hypothetical protein